MQCDMRALSPLTCQEKPSGVYKMQENALVAGAPPRTPLPELTTLPIPPSWWGRGWLPDPQELRPRLSMPLIFKALPK